MRHTTGTTAGMVVSLILANFFAMPAESQSSPEQQESVQQTRKRGYRADPSTALIRAAKDNGKQVSWRQAKNYCRGMRVSGFSDWRLPTLSELKTLIDSNAHAPQKVGSITYLHFNMKLEVNGGLLLTGQDEWSSTQIPDRGKPGGYVWLFDFVNVRPRKEDGEILFGSHAHAMCVRGANAAASD